MTRAGEDILARYDERGIAILRRHRLIWSSWKGDKLVTRDHHSYGSGMGVRVLKGLDFEQLRLFFLSVLWRAASTSLPEFGYVQIAASEKEQLRLMVLNATPEPQGIFAVRLAQLSTRGPTHNHAPLAATIQLGAIGPVLAQEVPIFRIYFDGLAAHYDRRKLGKSQLSEMGPLAVGSSDTLGVITYPFLDSFQARNLTTMLVETWSAWPAQMARL